LKSRTNLSHYVPLPLPGPPNIYNTYGFYDSILLDYATSI